MTVADFLALLARVSYKPKWDVVVWPGPVPDSVMVRLAFQAPDSTGAVAGETERALKHVVLPHQIAAWTEADALRFVFEKIMELERHEAREWFKLDGVSVDYPHGPTGELLP